VEVTAVREVCDCEQWILWELGGLSAESFAKLRLLIEGLGESGTMPRREKLAAPWRIGAADLPSKAAKSGLTPGQARNDVKISPAVGPFPSE